MRDANPICLSLALTLLLPAAAQPNSSGTTLSPQTESVEPRTAKAGSVITVKGLSLSKDRIDEVYLTDHRFDMQVKVLKQDDKVLQFRIPPFVKPGRLQLLYLTAGATPAYLEQPFFVQILEAEENVTPASAPTLSSAAPARVELASTSPQVPVVVLRNPDPPPAIAPVAVPARLLKQSPIVMPSGGSAANASAFGPVELLATVRLDGTVKDVRIVKGNPFLGQTAAASIRKWIYEPATVNGHPVEAQVPIILNLRKPR